MRRGRTATAALTAIVTFCGLTGLASAAPPSLAESEVTDDGAYVRHDGGTDPAITECSNPATAPDVPAQPTASDADPTDGGNRRQGNEPAVAIDPTNPNVLAAGWNDYCQADLAAGWQGLAFSTDRGATWTDSIVPGYPLDNSAEGSVSPLKGRTDAGDPLVAFDGDGRLFVGGIAFNRGKPQLGDVWVATYAATPSGGLPKDYLRTRVVGEGTPAVNGIFQDKPMLEVDRTGGANDGNVYVCWSRFIGVGNGTTKIYFSRSTDHGVTFSKGVAISGDKQVQGCDIAVEGDGDVYVSWRTADTQRPTDTTSMTVTRSANGGASFGAPRVAAAFTQYFPRVGGSRDCGDGAFFCGEPGYVFHRVPLEPRITADQSGALPGVWVTYNAVDPATTTAATSPYSSAGTGLVGRSVVYVKRSTNNGVSWSGATVLDQAGGRGHQYFPDVDALDGRLVAVWQDNRTDDDYSVQLPIGNKVVAGRAYSSGHDVTGTYAATSTDGVSWTTLGMVSSVTHQPQKEMFGSRQIPFQGDYNWAAVFPGGAQAYLVWTDNRDVVDGPDPRELAETPGYDDGFDVAQCLNDLGPAAEPPLNGNLPLARRDVPFSGNTCGNNGGLDQDIVGALVGLS